LLESDWASASGGSRSFGRAHDHLAVHAHVSIDGRARDFSGAVRRSCSNVAMT
jgi:hypothetical protein